MACYLVNISPSTAINLQTLEKVWTWKEVGYLSLRVFECPFYVHIHNEQRLKFDSKSKKCIFIGYKKGIKRYKLSDLTVHGVVINWDVVFDEDYRMKSNIEAANQQKGGDL